jgi:hypothetical protein
MEKVAKTVDAKEIIVEEKNLLLVVYKKQLEFAGFHEGYFPP